jgi:Tol biopolymer transport system component
MVSCLGVLFCAPSFAQVTQRMSVATDGTQGNGPSFTCAISADGRYVAFMSSASSMIPGGSAFPNIFVHDRVTAVTERVSVSSQGAEANGSSVHPSISADGRYVAFASFASNFASGDTGAHEDIFVHDRVTGVTEGVTVGTGALPANGDSDSPSISADGRYVAFSSVASNIDSSDSNGRWDVFVHDRLTGTNERVSLNSNGNQGNDDSFGASISADGRYVAFHSLATNLVSGDTNGTYDVFIHDRQTGVTERVSVDSNGTQGNNFSDAPSISADGRFVSFLSLASNLVAGDTNGSEDVFVHDLQNGTTERVSMAWNGAEGNSGSVISSISADGRYVAFYSHATNLVRGDTNNAYDIFVRDRQLGTTERVSLDSAGAQANGSSDDPPAISGDGRFVAFASDATNLVTGDTNGFTDVFVRDRAATGFASLCDPAVGGVIACPCANAPSASGRGCDNSSSTGGASLTAAGSAYLSMDTLVFTTSGEKPAALSVFSQGNTLIPNGVVFGQGVRCAGGSLKRLYLKTAVAGAASAPQSGDPTVSLRSAALGDPITAGSTRYYYVYYRDPIVLGGCPAASTFNSTQTGRVTWSL